MSCLGFGLFACTDGLEVPESGTMPCATLASRSACEAQPRCVAALGCPSCDGTAPVFEGCFDEGKAPLVSCPAVACAASCKTHASASSCEADPSCHALWADVDPSEERSEMVFSRCATGAPLCEPPKDACIPEVPHRCPEGYRVAFEEICGASCVKAERCDLPPGDCAARSESSCASATGCHAVYDGVGTCGCSAPGCCSEFIRCAQGPAVCDPPGPTLCDRTPPSCAEGYRVSYAGSCYEGCVAETSCAP